MTPDDHPEAPETAGKAEAPRRHYSPPVLHRYGDVRDLTMGTSELGTCESGSANTRRAPGTGG